MTLPKKLYVPSHINVERIDPLDPLMQPIPMWKRQQIVPSGIMKLLDLIREPVVVIDQQTGQNHPINTIRVHYVQHVDSRFIDGVELITGWNDRPRCHWILQFTEDGAFPLFSMNEDMRMQFLEFVNNEKRDKYIAWWKQMQRTWAKKINPMTEEQQVKLAESNRKRMELLNPGTID